MEKFSRAIKELEQYMGANYINSSQPEIMTETPSTFPDTNILNNITDTGAERLKNDVEMTYLENINTDEDLRQKLRNRGVYETGMYNIYNLIVGHNNNKIAGEGGIRCHLLGG